MKSLNERLTVAFNILIDEFVFLRVHNSNAFCKCPDEQLHFVTNHLSLDDVKVILSVCESCSLQFGIHSIPSSDGNSLSVIFRDSNHG